VVLAGNVSTQSLAVELEGNVLMPVCIELACTPIDATLVDNEDMAVSSDPIDVYNTVEVGSVTI
jgi:hypothetical protein